MKRVPLAGIVGPVALREAAASELGSIIDLVGAAVRNARSNDPFGSGYCIIDSVYQDRAVAFANGRYYAYPYTIADNNTVTLGDSYEVVPNFEPVGARVAEAVDQGFFIEAVAAAEASAPPRYLVRVIQAGTSLNGVTYPAAVLREAVAKFDGVRVFAKNDDDHVKGEPKAKDFKNLVGKLSDARFVEGKNGAPGEIQAVLDVLESSDVAAKLREAVTRKMTGLFGLSIDASGKVKKTGNLKEAVSLTKVDSVDLIIDPGAGGQVIRFTEAKNPVTESNDMLRQQMLDQIRQRDAKRADALATATDEQVLTAFREALAPAAAPAPAPAPAATAVVDALTAAQVDERFRMVEARADARVAIATSKLPQPAKERLTQRFAEAASFTAADVTAAIKAEGEYLGRMVESGAAIRGLGDSSIEAGQDYSAKVRERLDAIFDPSKPLQSFREAYREITGDIHVTGRIENCDVRRLREAAGADERMREAVSSTTFSSILGDSITRAMIREYGSLEAYGDWQWLVDIVPISDFRTQHRTRMGGYGNLPAVAENGSYNALTSPTDEEATYKISKRGGTETVSLETIANDDVGLIRRIPLALATAAGRTLYEYIFDFLRNNGAVYDTVALAHATHNNLGTAALSNTSFAAARLAIKGQTEKDSLKKLGLTLRHIAVPASLEETAFNMFVRGTNLDETFVQSRKPTVHVIDYWSDPTDWWATADKAQVPLIQLGFYGGRQEPELYVQDMPTQGSLFSNDQIKYKISHKYAGAVLDYRGFYGSVVADS